MTESEHVNLIIATPGHSLLAGYVKSLLGTLEVLAQENISVTFANAYASHVADAREITISGTTQNNILESKPLMGAITYDKILWIDSDIMWEPKDVLRLYRSDKDIVTGAYLLADGSTAVHPKMFYPPFSYQDVQNKTELEEIEGCGFGFIAVKHGVFENLPRPWFQSANSDITIDGTPYNFNVIGEDLSWCIRVKRLGYKIWFDPSVKVTHHKMYKLTWEGVKP